MSLVRILFSLWLVMSCQSVADEFQEQLNPAVITISGIGGGSIDFGRNGLIPLQNFFATGYRLESGVAAFELEPIPSTDPIVRMGTVQYRNNRHPQFNTNPLIAQMQLEAIKIRSGPVSVGDVVPMFGWLYLVTRIEKGRDAPRQRVEIRFKKLARGDWPTGIQPKVHAYSVMAGGSAALKESLGRTPAIRVNFDHEAKRFVLELAHDIRLPDGTFIEQNDKRSVEQGLCFPVRCGLGVQHFSVVEIVAPNPKMKVTGWITIRRIWPGNKKGTQLNSQY